MGRRSQGAVRFVGLWHLLRLLLFIAMLFSLFGGYILLLPFLHGPVIGRDYVESLPSTICWNLEHKPHQTVPIQLSLQFSECMLPHPEKAYRGGEDAYFIARNKLTFGVADGVGGWNLEQIDPSAYSRTLMRAAEKAVNDDHTRDPLQLLCTAEENAKNLLGSATAVVANLHGNMLSSANIGDSGLVVVRNGLVVHRSEEQSRAFNTPFQLGVGGDGLDEVALQDFKVQPDDLIIMASDGLWDNLFEDQILQIVERDAANKATLLCETAMEMARTAAETPFSQDALRHGLWLPGGKVDDITVLVAAVV